MTSRHLMAGSSVCLAAGGAACLFAPDEVMSALDLSGGSAVIVQLIGALYLASAAANWLARGVAIGGIYARPLALANVAHFVIGGLVLARGMTTDPLNVPYACVVAAYAVQAVLFMLLLYGRLRGPASR